MTPTFALETANAADLEELVQLRIETMRESLERLGRFDPARARERMVRNFEPEFTWFIVTGGVRAGCIVVRQRGTPWLLDHFYIRALFRNAGLGSQVLQHFLAQADATQAPLRLGALRESAANRFYLRHGFVQVDEDEWDIYYLRTPSAPR
jgi:GNAT superfamily N-acetyltransferase